MAQNYQKIGDYISVVDNRNTDGSITNLMGISIDKCYIPSVANVIGTDLHNYKVIRKGQFACSLMQVSRDQRIPLAMYMSDESAIMSPAYVMFEVNRPDELLPEYLELWFKRAEFDREASFYAVGGVRGSLDWEDFRKMKLPVPSLPEQRKIVHDYQVITDRIELLRKMNENLENLGETVYKGVFEAYREELPDDWHIHKLSEYLPVITGKKDVNTTCSNGKYPFFSCSQDCLWTDEFSFNTEAILVAGNGDFNVKYYSGMFEAYQRTYVLIPDNKKYVGWLYFVIKSNLPKAVTAARGSVISFITKGILEEISFPVPDDDNELLRFCDQATGILSAVRKNNDEINSLEQLRSLILSNMRNAYENDRFEICR